MNNFLEIFNEQGFSQINVISPIDLIISLGFALVLSAIMFITYRLCHDSLTYNKKFNITLVMISFVSTVLLALIQNNPLLSLGVLGSFSICRVRTNTRDPRDLGFIFWALAIGISSAVGAFSIGLISSLILGTLLIIFNHAIKKKKTMMMVIRGSRASLDKVQKFFGDMPGTAVQCKNIFSDSFEMVYELQMKPKEENHILALLSDMDGIHGINFLAPETKVV